MLQAIDITLAPAEARTPLSLQHNALLHVRDSNAVSSEGIDPGRLDLLMGMIYPEANYKITNRNAGFHLIPSVRYVKELQETVRPWVDDIYDYSLVTLPCFEDIGATALAVDCAFAALDEDATQAEWWRTFSDLTNIPAKEYPGLWWRPVRSEIAPVVGVAPVYEHGGEIEMRSSHPNKSHGHISHIVTPVNHNSSHKVISNHYRQEPAPPTASPSASLNDAKIEGATPHPVIEYNIPNFSSTYAQPAPETTPVARTSYSANWTPGGRSMACDIPAHNLDKWASECRGTSTPIQAPRFRHPSDMIF